jgi:hypothetical protein
MIRTRQTVIEDRENSVSESIFRLIETVSKVKTMNQTSNIFESQIMKTIKVSTQQKFDYATLQIELNQFEQKRKRIELLKKIEKTRMIKTAEFSETQLIFLMNRIMIDELQKKKFFKIMNSKKYKSTTQHDLNIFIRECREIFEIRRHIYFDDKNKILFVRSFLENVSTKNWKKHQKIIDIIFISWKQFIDFLQKHFNSKHLRLLETNVRLKKTRQLNEQSMTNLIVYFNNLKMQLLEELIDYQKYFNLMKALHFYLKTTIIRRINAIVFRNELKEIARLIEKIELVSKHIKKIKKKMINEFKTHRFQFYERDRFDVVDASQKTIQNNNRSENRDRKEFRKRDRDRDRKNFNFNQSFERSSNRSQIECWNCEMKNHYARNCKRFLKDDQKKKSDQST